MNCVKFDEQANAACRQINEETVGRADLGEEGDPAGGGVTDRYNQIIGGDKATKASE